MYTAASAARPLASCRARSVQLGGDDARPSQPRLRLRGSAFFARSALATTRPHGSADAAPSAAEEVVPAGGASSLRDGVASALGASVVAAVAIGGSSLLLHPAVACAAESAASAVTSAATEPLSQYFFKTLIAWGVPVAALALPALAFAAISAQGRARRARELEGTDEEDEEDDSTAQMVPPFLKGLQKKKKGSVKEYLKIESLNERLESYRFSLDAALTNRRSAVRQRRRTEYTRKFGDEIGASLTDKQLKELSEARSKYEQALGALRKRYNAATKAVRNLAVEEGAKASKSDDNQGSKQSRSFFGGGEMKKATKDLSEATAALASLESGYLKEVSAILDSKQRETFNKLVATGQWTVADGPWNIAGSLADGLVEEAGETTGESVARPSKVFVLTFSGLDATASFVPRLREEITAVLRGATAENGDEVVLVLSSGGGTVTGYGLAAAQLVRIREAGLKLTICVEQAAASGGYLMACVGSQILSSPFAVLGSIGVISELPNAYERLKREGIQFETITAGKFKRTLTPFKKPTEEDRAKSKKDIEMILVLFKNFVHKYRPSLDIENVATGETWFGQDALDRNLCDELKTVDDYLLEKLDEGARIFKIKYREPSMAGLMNLLGAQNGGLMQQLQPSWRTTLASLLVPELLQAKLSGRSVLDASTTQQQWQTDTDQSGVPYRLQMPHDGAIARTVSSDERAQLLADLLED